MSDLRRDRSGPPISGRSDRLRVVYLDHTAALSGGELALLRLVQAAAEFVDPHVILAEPGPLVGRLEAVGVPTEVMPLCDRTRSLHRDGVTVRSPPARAVPDTLLYARTLSRRLRELRPSIVHTNSLKSGIYGALAAELAGVPLVWHLRDRLDDAYMPAAGQFIVRLASRRLADAVICNSQTTLRSLRGNARATVIPSIALPAPEHAAPGPSSAALTVGMVGRLAPWKGQDLFLRAFADAYPTGDTRAVIIGGAWFGPEEAAFATSLPRLAATLGIADRVDFRGHRSDVAAELARLDMLVHASVVPEPFGQTVVEGMAAGLTVLAARAGGPEEIITNGHDGILYEPGDRTALAEAMSRAGADPALRVRLGQTARLTATAYGPDAVVDRLMQVYRSVVPVGSD